MTELCSFAGAALDLPALLVLGEPLGRLKSMTMMQNLIQFWTLAKFSAATRETLGQVWLISSFKSLTWNVLQELCLHGYLDNARSNDSGSYNPLGAHVLNPYLLPWSPVRQGFARHSDDYGAAFGMDGDLVASADYLCLLQLTGEQYLVC